MKAIRFLLLATIFSVVLLEGVLQLLSLGAHALFSEDQSSEIAKGNKVLLCIGDSYTFGFGATNPEMSYPSQLEKKLREDDEDWAVMNVAYPSKNSAEAFALALPKIRAGGIHTAIMLIGTNDVWSIPPKVEIPPVGSTTSDSSASAWRFECRTLRLLKTFRQLSPWKKPPTAANTLIPQALFLALQSSDPTLAAPESPPTQHDPIQFQDAWDLIFQGKPHEAKIIVEQWENETIEEKIGRTAALAQIAGNTAHSDENRDGLIRLSELVMKADASEIGEQHAVQTVLAFTLGGDIANGLEPAEKLVREYPNNFQLSFFTSQLVFNSGDIERAKELNDRSLELMNPTGGDAFFWRFRAKLYAQVDPYEMASCLVKAFTTAPENISVGQDMQFIGIHLKDEHFEAAYKELTPSEEHEKILRHFWAQAQEGLAPTFPGNQEGGVADVLQHNLTQFIQICKENQVRPILVSYPFFDPMVGATQQATAEKNGVTFVNTSEVFEAELAAGKPYEDLFISDGHCSDQGYGLMAETIHERLMAD